MSILDQVRKNQLKENISSFNPVNTLDVLFASLSDKEKDIIKKRFGLGEIAKQTLEEIGDNYGITRERVRQIENLSIKKLKQLQELKEEINGAETVVADLLEQYGGVMEESFFLENLLGYLEEHPNSQNSLLFLAEYIFSDNINKIKRDKEFNNLWRVNSADVETLKQVIAKLVAIIETNQKPLRLQELLDIFKNSDFYKQNREKFLAATTFLEATDQDIDKVLESYLRASRKIKQNLFAEWGLMSWGTIQPKKINDKIYVILKQAGKPMHFTTITTLINEAKFDEKIAYAPTVHNELILDDQYILVGRGIYALKEWGYEPGSVAEVIAGLLREKKLMTKEQIIEEVLKKRDVKRSTVYLSLMNNKSFQKGADGRYSLAAEPAEK